MTALALVVVALVGCGSKGDELAPGGSGSAALGSAASGSAASGSAASGSAASGSAASGSAAPAKPPTAIDLDTLESWPTPALANTNPTVEVYAADASADELLFELAGKHPLVGRAVKTNLTGRTSAPTEEDAFAAVATRAGFVPQPISGKGRGAKMFFTLIAGDPTDAILMIDTMSRMGVVVRGPLPDLVVKIARVPWDDALEAIAGATGRERRRVGGLWYLLAPGETPPVVAKGTPRDWVSVYLKDATVTEAFGALAGVKTLPARACGDTKLTLELQHVPVTEVVQAIAFAANTTLSADAACDVPNELPDQDDDVVATSAAFMASAAPVRSAVLRRKGASYVIRSTDNLQPLVFFWDRGISMGADASRMPTPVPVPERVTYAEWRGRLVRTIALVRSGAQWRALIATTKGFVRIEAGPLPAELGPGEVKIDRGGVTLPADPAEPASKPLVLPLAR